LINALKESIAEDIMNLEGCANKLLRDRLE
jgi:hypothetical protein